MLGQLSSQPSKEQTPSSSLKQRRVRFTNAVPQLEQAQR